MAIGSQLLMGDPDLPPHPFSDEFKKALAAIQIWARQVPILDGDNTYTGSQVIGGGRITHGMPKQIVLTSQLRVMQSTPRTDNAVNTFIGTDATGSFLGTNILGLEVYTVNSPVLTSTQVGGIGANTEHDGIGIVTRMIGVGGSVIIRNSGGGTDAVGVNGSMAGRVGALATGTFTNGYAFWADTFGAGFTNKWGIYIKDATANNYFAGNVGVGTATPTNGISSARRTLHILDNTGGGAAILRLQSGNGVSGGAISVDEVEPMRFFTGLAERMRILGNGAVGINTDTPSYQLDVKAPSTGDGNLDAIADFYKDSTNQAQLLIRATNTIIDFAASTILGGGGPNCGISFSTTPSGGAITERGRWTKDGVLLIGTPTANGGMTLGITINQGAADDEILALKSSDVAHGMTTLAETDTFGRFTKHHPTDGGVTLMGLRASSVTGPAISLNGNSGSVDTTKSTAAVGVINVTAALKSGTTSATLGANGNIIVFKDAGTTRFILDADGDSHQDVGTAWTNFDDFQDIELLHALSAGVSRAFDPLKVQFGRFLEQHRATLERMQLVTFNSDGHHFVNWSRIHMLQIGAIRQLAHKIEQMELRLGQG